MAAGAIYSVLALLRLLFRAGRVATAITDVLFIAASLALTGAVLLGLCPVRLRPYHILGVLAGFAAFELLVFKKIYRLAVDKRPEKLCNREKRIAQKKTQRDAQKPAIDRSVRGFNDQSKRPRAQRKGRGAKQKQK